jgi:hypothetical protein
MDVFLPPAKTRGPTGSPCGPGGLQNRFKYMISLYALGQATGKFPAGRLGK